MQLDPTLSLRGRLIITLVLVAGLALWLLPGLAATQAGAGRAEPIARVAPARGPLSSDPDELHAKAAQQGRLRVLATLNVPYQAEQRLAPAAVSQQRAVIQAATQRVLARLAGARYQRNATYQIYPFVGVSIDSAGLAALLGSPDVLRVTESLPKHPSDLESNMIIGADIAKSASYTGNGYVVAVLDSGVQTTHPFLAGRTVAEACFSRTQAADNAQTLCPNGQSTSLSGAPAQTGAGAGANCSLTIDGCEHGTHVAGIALGKNYAGGPGYDGVAPGAGLIAIQVFSKFTSGCGTSSAPCLSAYDEDILAALQYVQITLAPAHTIAAVNMSLGDGTNNATPCDTSSYFTAVANLRALNIATVIAAGNEGYSGGLSGPACVSNAISVGSTTKSDDISSFSNRASYMSLFAPGSGIDSSVPSNTYGNLSGTSMATPHVAGAWAVMRQRYPSESVAQILNRLQTTGKPIAISASKNIARIQLNTALGLAAATPTATPPPTSTPNPDPSYMIQDGGFELGTSTPHWAQESTNFNTPICSLGSCGGVGPRTGTYWAWFGGTSLAEQGVLTQTKKIALGPKQLTFWLWWSSGNDATSSFKVKLDGAEIFALNGSTSAAYRSNWTAVAIDISTYADGNMHILRFEQSNHAGKQANVHLDDINFGNPVGTPTATGSPTATGMPTATSTPTATPTTGLRNKLHLPLVIR
jgi:subtilisin family serine protease